jgi:tetratricopeptide (TPR) repeat protein
MLVELARLYAGPLADHGRAALACAAALAADPASAEAASVLGELLHGVHRGHDPASEVRVDALVAGLGGVNDEQARRARIVASLQAAYPALAEGMRPAVDDGSTRRAASAAGWARAATGGDAAVLAGSLERIATIAAPGVRAVLLSAAADRLSASGNREGARRLTELAMQVDPASARCVATLADVFVRQRDRPAAAAFERAIALVGPRISWCTALADALDALVEPELAVGWSQRIVALCPGDRDAIEKLLQRLLRARDGGRLGDALAWLLSQPQPAAWLAAPFARALDELANLDPDRAAVVARRALDVFGPKWADLREAMLRVAERASDKGFTAAVLERWLGCGAEGADRAELYATLARIREHMGDVEAEVRIVARAVHEGLRSQDLEDRLARLSERSLGHDALLWRMRARAELEGKKEEGVQAWRELGAALWDLAEDRMGAVTAWQRAARLSPWRGHVTMALDLVEFAGADFAFEYLARLVDSEPDDANAATIAADAGRAALTIGEWRLALDLATRGITRSPSCADALEVAERAVDKTRDEFPALSGLYQHVANRALGRFGRRAAHYRGARFFERRGENALALRHAAQAFYAVPSEGSSFQLLARAAERAGDRFHAVRTIEHVAEGARGGASRASWLLRAASIAGEGEEGARRKVDVLLRAAVASPNVATIAMLRDAARELLRYSPEERDGLEMRLARAARTITERLDGPEGARVAVVFAETSLDLFDDAGSALACVVRAFACDADIDEYAALLARAPVLARTEDAGARVAALVDAAEKPHANVGIPVLRLLGAIGTALHDDRIRARAAVLAASREPDEDALVVEADAAVRAVPELADRLAKRVTPARRGEALLAAARARAHEAAYGDAAQLFERAVELLKGDVRAEAERELRVAWEAAGRGNEIEERVQREAASDEAPQSMRADRWSEIAERREARGDKEGAVRAQFEACKLDPKPLERWSALERLAELAEDDETRVHALEHIAERVGNEGRVPVFKRLARAHERRRDLDAAMRTWQQVIELDPEDEVADQAIESVIVARGHYEELVDHLARRAERLSAHSGTREMLRAVRLRRAAILEQRLGRLHEACDELALLLNEWPDNVSALRYLADLLDRQGEHARSAPLWRKAAAVEVDATERDDLELRAGRASFAAGDVQAALDRAKRVLERRPSHTEALALRIETARTLGSDRELGDALDSLAGTDGADPRTRSDLLLEASHAAARTGDSMRALDRARRAAAASPDRGTPQLLARGLEYRFRGAGDPAEARHTIEELARIREPLGQDDEALRAFLLAEALDVVQGGSAGFKELEATNAIIGAHPLIALGFAERFVGLGQYPEAVESYLIALSGSLLELRNRGRTALAAADAAERAARYDDAEWFLEIASGHEDTQTDAKGRRARLSETVARARSVAPPAVEEAVATSSGRPPPTSGRDPALEPLEAAVRTAPTPAQRAQARLSLGQARLERGDTRGAEPLLWEALADGLVAAGDLLAPLVASSGDRTRDLVRVRRQQVSLEPGDIDRLESLRVAAMADDDRVYARAVEHVLRAFDPGAGPLPPPPLYAQPDEPGILAILVRPSMDVAGEALALLWDGAMQLFVRDAASYGITGVERVVPGSTSTIARLYESAMRMLDTPRIPLFVPRATTGTPASHVALLSPPSVILAGDVREETTELRFALGRGMAAALPQNVLRLGLPPAEGQTLVEALRAAFGAPEMGRRVDARVARLAESFWQIVPARAQRRLQEVLGATPVPDYEELVQRAHQSGRRVGMFLAGDFAFAARTLLAESTHRSVEPPSLATLGALCEAEPALADLLRLAVSPEYAAARWHSVTPAPPRGTISSGRFSLF